jgi:hypothetical protein
MQHELINVKDIHSQTDNPLPITADPIQDNA